MPEERTLEGWVPQLSQSLSLAQVIEMAFDYRGDVTVVKTDGSEVVGYLFNRDATAPQPYVQVLQEGRDEPLTLLYSEIQNIKFTGKDAAFGKSWEAWVRKREQMKARRAAGLPDLPEDEEKAQ